MVSISENLININISIPRSQRGKVRIPNVLTRKWGEHYYAPEDLDKGLPITVESAVPITISNVLFVGRHKGIDFTLHNYCLPEARKVRGVEILRVPWKEAFVAGLLSRNFEVKHQKVGCCFLVIYDMFTEKRYPCDEPYHPQSMWDIATECDEGLDKIYEDAFGFSLRKVRRARTFKERQVILGFTQEDMDELERAVRNHLKKAE